MALSKFKQIASDPDLKKIDAAEAGFARFAHLNKVVDEVNSISGDIVLQTVELSGAIDRIAALETYLNDLDLLDRDYADDTAALADGLVAGDLYHNAGALRIVVTV